MEFGILESLIMILFITLVTTSICRYFNLPVILGYLLAGSILGPHIFGFVIDKKNIDVLAEFGVILLMFTVGLEFSYRELVHFKRSAFLVGTLQVIFSILITALIGVWLKINLITATIIGGIVAMSSTAIVLKQLSDQMEINTAHGHHAIGILLFQDLAVIPLLIFISTLSTPNDHVLWKIMAESFGKGVLVISAIFVSGHVLLRPLFRLIMHTKQSELFTIAVLLVSVGSAWLTHQSGLSYALGAFIAGMTLSECEYQREIKAEIRPFRDILLGLFFISIGMLANFTAWMHAGFWIVLIVIALLISKPLLIMLISLLSGYSVSTACRSALLLAQGGEFGFAILTVALSHQLLPNEWGQSILAGMLICFIISPIMIRYNREIYEFLCCRTA